MRVLCRLLAVIALFSALPAASRPRLWVDGLTVVAGVGTVVLLCAAVDGLQFHRRGHAEVNGDGDLATRNGAGSHSCGSGTARGMP